MIFNSFQFLWLFPIIFAVYWGSAGFFKGKKQRLVGNSLLLLISYALYIQWKPVFALLLLGVTAVTYFAALLIERNNAYGRKRYIVSSGVILALLPLLTFKYYNFLNDTFTYILRSVNIESGLPGLNWAIPMGISFYTFMAVGYLFDVYYQRIKSEHNWWDYMLFVSFFPQIASGPISKAKDLLPQIKANRTFEYSQAVQGCRWLLWGMFLKVVVADRLGMYVDVVYGAIDAQSGLTCLTAMLAYSIQIYADFAGYSYMAIGVGRLLGFDLINNFMRPYFAASVTEFWKRWHISLTKWLTDYVYIPLGGSRCSKLKTYRNIMVTFLVSGIWHGANWTFVVWGALHGLFQIVEKFLGIQKAATNACKRIPRIAFTFVLTSIAWVFFRMPTIKDALSFFGYILPNFNSKPFFMLENDRLLYLWIGLLILFFVETSAEFRFAFVERTWKAKKTVRISCYLALLLIIALLGIQDSGNFIYFNF